MITREFEIRAKDRLGNIIWQTSYRVDKRTAIDMASDVAAACTTNYENGFTEVLHSGSGKIARRFDHKWI
jgi:hypothetical protein